MACVFVFLLVCIVFSSDQVLAIVVSPRMLFVFVLVLWMRCEWCLRVKVEELYQMARSHQTGGMVKENYELSQTVMNLSDQHTLLCEIRSGVHRSVKCSRDVLGHLNVSQPSAELLRCSSRSPPISKAKEHFKKGSASEGDLSLCRLDSSVRNRFSNTPPPQCIIRMTILNNSLCFYCVYEDSSTFSLTICSTIYVGQLPACVSVCIH